MLVVLLKPGQIVSFGQHRIKVDHLNARKVRLVLDIPKDLEVDHFDSDGKCLTSASRLEKRKQKLCQSQNPASAESSTTSQSEMNRQ